MSEEKNKDEKPKDKEWECKKCKYKWPNKKDKPKRCPRCQTRLDWGPWKVY